MHRDFAQVFAATWSRHAFATCQLKTRAVHRAHQQALFAAQEFTRRPIQAAPSVRADIEPSMHATAGIAMHDQRFCIAIDDGRDFVQAVRRHALQLQQSRMRAVQTIII